MLFRSIPQLDLEMTTASEGDLLPIDDNSSGDELTLPSRKKVRLLVFSSNRLGLIIIFLSHPNVRWIDVVR